MRAKRCRAPREGTMVLPVFRRFQWHSADYSSVRCTRLCKMNHHMRGVLVNRALLYRRLQPCGCKTTRGWRRLFVLNARFVWSRIYSYGCTVRAQRLVLTSSMAVRVQARTHTVEFYGLLFTRFAMDMV